MDKLPKTKGWILATHANRVCCWNFIPEICGQRNEGMSGTKKEMPISLHMKFGNWLK